MKKKHIFPGLFLILLCVNNEISAQNFINKDLQITLLEDKLWVIETPDKTSMYLIEGNDKALLIDTGTNCDSLNFIINQITKKPLQVVLTHAHPDHAGNIRFFDEIYMHAADTVLLKKPYYCKLNFIDEGYRFDLGGKLIDVVLMPAHTPGSIVLIDKKAGNCFSGDAFGSGQVWLQIRPFAPMETYINACSKMLKIMDGGIERIYCGHYPHAKAALTKNYMLTMLELATELNNGTAENPQPFDIKVSISCDNPMVYSKGGIGIVYDPEHIKF